MIVHCMKKELWKQRISSRYWGEEELEKSGFIHCSNVEYLWCVIPGIIDKDEEYVLICFDEDKLEAEIRYEDGSDGQGRYYPHVYGLINNDAVTMVLDVLRDSDGHYMKNPEFADIEDR